MNPYFHDTTVGEGNPMAKLTDADVREIRNHYQSGLSPDTLADVYHVSKVHVMRIVRRERWRNVE